MFPRFLILLIVMGLVWWLTSFLPLPPPFPTVIQVVIIVFLIWELLAAVGYTRSAFGSSRDSPPP